ncbi:MAG: DUF3106 domain-containing protein [Gammaproteobacteria bacterium]
MTATTALRLMLLTVMLASTALPASARDGIPWDALSREEQNALHNYRHNWSAIQPGEQEKLRQGAQRYLDLPPEKRQAVKRKHDQYEKMTPEERKRLRDKYRNKKSKH